VSEQKEMMKKLIEAKRQKSAAQGGHKRPEKSLSERAVPVTKQHKKGGLFDGK
jgi:hypothetical protein